MTVFFYNYVPEEAKTLEKRIKTTKNQLLFEKGFSLFFSPKRGQVIAESDGTKVTYLHAAVCFLMFCLDSWIVSSEIQGIENKEEKALFYPSTTVARLKFYTLLEFQ